MHHREGERLTSQATEHDVIVRIASRIAAGGVNSLLTRQSHERIATQQATQRQVVVVSIQVQQPCAVGFRPCIAQRRLAEAAHVNQHTESALVSRFCTQKSPISAPADNLVA